MPKSVLFIQHASVSPIRLSPAGPGAQNGDRWLPPVKLQFQCSTITKGFDPVAYFTKYPGWLISMPRDLLCALTANKGHLCFATARRGRCFGRTNRLVKTCELTRRAFVWCQGAQQVPRLPPDFLSGLVALVNFMRLSLEKAAYVAVNESSVVGNPEYAPAARRGRRDDKWRVVTFIRGCQIGWTEKQQQVPRLPPDFLSGLVVSVDFMRLCSNKAAYVVVVRAA